MNLIKQIKIKNNMYKAKLRVGECVLNWRAKALDEYLTLDRAGKYTGDIKVKLDLLEEILKNK